MQENIIVKLTSKDDKYACAIADKIISESRENNTSFSDQPMYYAFWIDTCPDGAHLVCNYQTSSGVWADRYPRKRLIIGADVLIALATFMMLLVQYLQSAP